MLTSFLAALQFLTILPPIVRRPFTMSELGNSVGFFPLVGGGLGLILWGVAWGLSQLLATPVVATLILILWLLSTGAIHFDGFLDMCDGIFGGSDPESRLNIMRDHRVGAFATAGGAVLLLLQFAALTSMPDKWLGPSLLLAPIWGRWAAAQAIVWMPYAREQGLGRAMKDHARWPQALLATILLIPIFFFFPVAAAVAMLTSIVVVMGISIFALRRIPGLTGDVYGAIIIITEVAVLVLLTTLT